MFCKLKSVIQAQDISIITTGDAAWSSSEVAHKLKLQLSYFIWKWTDRESSHTRQKKVYQIGKNFMLEGIMDFEPETQKLHSIWSKAVLRPCWDQSLMQQLHTSQAGVFTALNTSDGSPSFPT